MLAAQLLLSSQRSCEAIETGPMNARSSVSNRNVLYRIWKCQLSFGSNYYLYTTKPPCTRDRDEFCPFNTYILFVDAVHGSATDSGPGWAPSPSPLLEGPAPREGRVRLQHSRNTSLNACMHHAKVACARVRRHHGTPRRAANSSPLLHAMEPRSRRSQRNLTRNHDAAEAVLRREGSAACLALAPLGQVRAAVVVAALQLSPALKHRMAMWRFGRRGEQVGDVVWTHGPVKT